MKRKGVKLGLLVTAVAVFGVYWAVSAQERPMPENRAPASARFPGRTQPLIKKSAPDPASIIPPDVYEEPRPITAPVEIRRTQIVQTAGQLPPPMFPPYGAEVNDKKTDDFYPPPPAPVVEPKHLVMPPLPEPTKALIVDAPAKEAAKKTDDMLKPTPTLVIPAPVVKVEGKKDDVAPPTLDELPAKKNAPIPPPAPIEMPAKKNAPIPPPAPIEMPAKKDVPVVQPSPLEIAPPRKEIPVVQPSPLEIAPPKKEIPVVQPAPFESPNPAPLGADGPVNKVKSFVRIAPSTPPEPVRDVQPVEKARMVSPPALDPLKFPPVSPASGGGLVNLNTPAIAVEKRGPATMRGGETQTYQIVLRNLGGGPAQHIRVEDEIPAGTRLMNAEPAPLTQGNRAAWILTALAHGGEQTIRLTLKADADVQLANSTSVHVSAANVTQRVARAASAFAVRIVGPERVGLGKQANYDIHVQNSTGQTLTDIVLHAELPAGLVMLMKDAQGKPREERHIEGPVDGMVIAPGEHKILKMPTTAAKPGRYPVNVKVATAQGEIAASTEVEVAAEALVVEQLPTARLMPGRDVDLRIEMANHTGKPLKNVQVATHLPEGFTFLGASDRGLYQANTRTAHWLFDTMPAGVAKTLVVRVHTSKSGQYQNVVSSKADGLPESRSVSTILLEGAADLSMRVIEKDNPLEVGRETVYEIQVTNNGSAATSNVKLNVQFPSSITPKNAQAPGRFSVDGQGVAFEPIATLAPAGQATFRVLAIGQTAGRDQRVRFSVASDEVKTPVERELSVLVYSGN